MSFGRGREVRSLLLAAAIPFLTSFGSHAERNSANGSPDAELSTSLGKSQGIVASSSAERAIDLVSLARPAQPPGLEIDAPLVSGKDGVSLGRAVTCLADAIYYEAGQETENGQRAVAQVVLNRVRHRAFPNTVCGVVYQGASRSTGCQFTFTCDGSLAHRPTVAGMARAKSVARGALGGSVFPAVGRATHYHADYVDPYWSGTLNLLGRVGAHIFYVWRGRNGSSSHFDRIHTGTEPFVSKEALIANRRLAQPATPIGEEPATPAPTADEGLVAPSPPAASSNGIRFRALDLGDDADRSRCDDCDTSKARP